MRRGYTQIALSASPGAAPHTVLPAPPSRSRPITTIIVRADTTEPAGTAVAATRRPAASSTSRA